MTKFYVSVTYNGVVEDDDICKVYDAFPENIYLDSGLGALDYDSAEVDEYAR